MDKLKKGLKNLFAPAFVLVLVAVMGVFSPVVSVAAALRLNAASAGNRSPIDAQISGLPAHTVKVGSDIVAPTISTGSVELWHAGRDISGSATKYSEVGQYEWRFIAGGHVFQSYTVTATESKYTMTVPSDVVTVAPKGLNELKMPLPTSYTVDGNSMEIISVNADNVNHYAEVTLKNKKDKNDNGTTYRLYAEVALENDTFASDKVSFDDKNAVIDLSSHHEATGKLKITYLLKDSSDKLLVAVPLSTVEIKNVNKSEVTFANIPTAPSVSNLSYYSTVSLTAPTADSAKVGKNSFSVEAQTSIVKVQAYLFSTEPNKWSQSNVHNLTVENGVVKEGDAVSDILEIDGLNVKIKKLGWYRFQFETTTLFGYQLDKDFNNYDAIEQDSNKSYVRYWSDSVRIYRDNVEPNFAWVKDYSGETSEYENNFSDYLDQYALSLPMTEKPDATTAKKATVNFEQGLVLPAIYPHDNATSFADLKITAFNVEQIQDVDGKSVSNNYAWKGETTNSNTFTYSMNKSMKIGFAPDGTQNQGDNNVTLKSIPGLYRVRIVVEEKQPKFEGNNEYYSGGYAQTKTKYLYFYADSKANFNCEQGDNNSPVIDENNKFMISDVYLWESHKFDFPAPTYSDAHTATDNIQVDYYLVQNKAGNNEVIAKLDYTKGASRITVDLDNLHDENGVHVNFSSVDKSADSYIYAVARNFNGMQANLKNELGVGAVKYFNTGLFNSTNTVGAGQYKDADTLSEYGYAWKRAKFNFFGDTNANSASITATFNASNVYTAGKAIKIDSIVTSWGATEIDGQMSVALYLKKANGTLSQVDIVNSNDASAEVVSSVAFRRKNYTMSDLYFTPGVSGEYILVVTAKEYASKNITTQITPITIDANTEISVRPRSVNMAPASNESDTVDETITLGSSLTLPDYDLYQGNTVVYTSKNHVLTQVSDNTQYGDYTITVIGVSDANCITGNKFVPTKTGKYKFQYEFYATGALTPFKTVNYVVQVNPANSSTNILMGEDYNKNKVIFNGTENALTGNIELANGGKYDLGANSTGKNEKPAYAITLDQFKLANYGAPTDFVVDSASLFGYLEPAVDESNNITGYMYPAIAIPMPNVVADANNSTDVEITVQKSGSSSYLVSSKKLNAGGKESVIDKIGDFYVFRPEGTFSADCKNQYNENNYLMSATSLSSVSGVYTVTYKTNSTSVSYNIAFGNLENGEISWSENFLTYNNGKEDKAITDSVNGLIIDKDSNGHRYVTIDMSKVFFSGNDEMLKLIEKGPNGDGTTDGYNSANSDAATEYYWKKVTVTVSFEDGSFIDYDAWSDSADETKAIKDHSGYKYKFDLTKGSGTYRVNIKMNNSYTSSPVTASIEFTLDAESTNKNVNLNTVWGIILIVLSVGLFAGVIFYFVKTARATRFVDAPRSLKAKVKKDDKKSVEAPKTEEAQKNDAK
ncbi:MAG: hypothetical protein MJ054_00030 [Clostridia bacterium]|nr:hypothetical protein [Clostridia bacterium]